MVTHDRRIARRELLRRLSVAGAAAWAAPVLATGAASAAASPMVSAKKLCKGFHGNCTGSFGTCGPCSSDVGDGSFCFAYLTADGTVAPVTICAKDVFCSEVKRCLRSTDCTKGHACTTMNGCTDCDSKYGVCSKKCKRRFSLDDPPRRPPIRSRRRTAVPR